MYANPGDLVIQQLLSIQVQSDKAGKDNRIGDPSLQIISHIAFMSG